MRWLRVMMQRGVFYTLAIVFNRVIPEWLFRMRYFVVYEIDVTNSLQQRSAAQCRWSESGELDVVKRLTHFAGNLPENYRSIVAVVDREVVGAFWAARDQFDELDLGLRFQLKDNQAWLFGAMVKKNYRGQRIFPDMIQFISCELLKQNVSGQFASVNPFNRPSMNVFKQKSLGRVSRAIVIRIFKLSFGFSTSGIVWKRQISWKSDEIPIECQLR
ncbi:MAG: hypothetical protein AAGA30_02005 [Planctomycetota bacterium]